MYNVEFSFFCNNTAELGAVKHERMALVSVLVLMRTCSFRPFPFLHLTGFIHLYSAQLLESLSDKSMKEGVRDGWAQRGQGWSGGEGSSRTVMKKVSLPQAAPDLSHNAQ